MRAFIAVLFLMMFGPGLAADAIIKDGDSLTLNGTAYRLDGIDAPERGCALMRRKLSGPAATRPVIDWRSLLTNARCVARTRGPIVSTQKNVASVFAGLRVRP